MQFLKTLFWAAFAVVVVLFAHGNWYPVQLKLWGDLEADVKLPVLVFAAFLLGFLPTFALYRARLWSLRRRIETQERNLVNAQIATTSAGVTPPPPVAPTSNATVEGLS